jgi:hypothetical protein
MNPKTPAQQRIRDFWSVVCSPADAWGKVAKLPAIADV